MRFPRWLRKPFDRSKSLRFPARMDVVPGRLKVRIFEETWTTALGETSGYVLLTEGMESLDQKEFILGIARDPGDGPELLGEFIQLFDVIFDEACRGNIVDVGGVTTLRALQETRFMSPGGYSGLLYTYPTAFWAEGPYLETHLAMVPVKAKELEIAAAYGHTRVLAKLGHRHLYYPSPPFAERRRPDVFEQADLESSIVAKTQIISCYDSCVWAEDTVVPVQEDDTPGDYREGPWTMGEIIVTLGAQAARTLAEAVPRVSGDHPLTLLTSVYPDLKRCLVYVPPPGTPTIIRDGHFREPRCAGAFILFGGRNKGNMARRLEDGFGVPLDNTSWDQVLEALGSGTPLTLPPSDDFPGLKLVWRQ